MTRYRVLAATVTVLVVLGGLPMGVVAQDDNSTANDVEEKGAAMEFDFDLSLFSNFPDRGEIGFQIDGYVDGDAIISVDIAVIFEGIGPAGDFFNDPMSRFGTSSEIDMDLSFLAGSSGESSFRSEERTSG